MNEHQALESFADGLIAALEPAARKALAGELARELRTRNTKRIAAQINPDGSAFEPRKPQLRHRKGKIRRQMFSKMRTARFLKAESSPDAAIVTFTRDVERIARSHHFGLRDIVNRLTGKTAEYPARRLLGIPEDDETAVREMVLNRLADRL